MFSAFLLYLVISEMLDMYPYTPYLQMGGGSERGVGIRSVTKVLCKQISSVIKYG